MKTINYVFLTFALASCATAPRVVGGSVPLISYDAKFQSDTSAEMKAHCDDVPHVCQMVRDYGKTRNAIRALAK